MAPQESPTFQPGPQVASPAPAPEEHYKPPKGGHMMLWTLLFIILLAAGVGGTYYWQHKKVNDLNTQVSSLNTQLTNAKSQNTTSSNALAALPNIVQQSATAASSVDLVAFLGGNNTGCYKTSSPLGWFEVNKEVSDTFALLQYGCLTSSQTTPSGTATYIIAKKSSNNWTFLNPTNNWVTVNSVQYPTCTMINNNKVSTSLEAQCATSTTTNGTTTYKLQAVTNP